MNLEYKCSTNSVKDTHTINADSEDNKVFVRKGVAFVISHSRNGFVPLCASVATLLKEQAKLKKKINSLEKEIEEKKSFCLKHRKKIFQESDLKALHGCLCNYCSEASSSNLLSPPLKTGDRVVIQGEMCGTVCYVGHLESVDFPEIFVGLHLDESVGDSDGMIGGKRYFMVPYRKAIFVSLFKVLCKLK